MAKRKELTDAPESKYARKRSLDSSKLIVIEKGIPKYLTITAPFTSRMMKKKPATFANVTDLETGEIGLSIISRVLQSKIEENFPAESYVGKSFEIVRGEMVKGGENSYSEFEVYEIDA